MGRKNVSTCVLKRPFQMLQIGTVLILQLPCAFGRIWSKSLFLFLSLSLSLSHTHTHTNTHTHTRTHSGVPVLVEEEDFPCSMFWGFKRFPLKRCGFER